MREPLTGDGVGRTYGVREEAEKWHKEKLGKEELAGRGRDGAAEAA